MTRWQRAAADLRHALTRRSHLLLRPLPITAELYSTSTSTSSPSKTPRKSKTTKPPPPPQQSPKSWVTYGAASAQMDKIMLGDKEERDEMKVFELDEGRWPKPKEIPWQAKVANCVSLIGHIKMPVQFRSDDDGKKNWACSIIRQETISKSNPLWMPVLFEGDLAHVVACHVKENDYVYVAGYISAEPSPFNPYTRTQPLQVIVESINFVDESTRLKKYFSHAKPIDDQKQKDEPSQDHGDAFDDNASVKQSWKDLLLKPHEWWDIRLERGSSNAAAFKRKGTGELLFIDEFTPQWLLRKLECLTFDHQVAEAKQQTASGKTHDAALGAWKGLLEDTAQWQDYRKSKLDGKVNAKHPDFKRKDRSISLWLSSAPKSILFELENLDFGVPCLSPQQAKRSKGEEFWKDVIENPHKWWDNRLKKLSSKSPDFKHKDTGEGVWLTDAPAWAISNLPPSKATPKFGNENKETMLS